MAAEGKTLVKQEVARLEAMTFDDLRQFLDNEVDDTITGPSGERYRRRIYAFWDMEKEKSDLYVHVKLYGTGFRRLKPYFGIEVRHEGEAPRRRTDSTERSR